MTVGLVVSATTTLSSGFVIEISPVMPVAQLIAGAPIFRYTLDPNQVLNATAGVLKAPGRYLALQYTIAGSAETTGYVFSYMTPNLDRNVYYSYPIGYTAKTTTSEI
jgi:hypothetical protein